MTPQQPIVRIGTLVHLGDWRATVEAILDDRVVLLMEDNRRIPVKFDVIERAVAKV